jgi:hypothetical protein
MGRRNDKRFSKLTSHRVVHIHNGARAAKASFGVRAAIQALQTQYPVMDGGKNSNGSKKKAMTFTWDERLGEKDAPRLTKLEQRVLELLNEGSKTKMELIESLYGDRLSQSVTQNRLHNLMSRLRKRFPELIRFDDGKYFLTEAPFLKRAQRRNKAVA